MPADGLIPNEKLFVDPVRVEMELAEARVYADAVARRHFPDMRRAAYATAGRGVPAKIVRLREIIAESADDDWKVIIFSQFRHVIDTISAALAGSPQIVPTGEVPPARRHVEIILLAASATGALAALASDRSPATSGSRRRVQKSACLAREDTRRRGSPYLRTSEPAHQKLRQLPG